MASPFIKWSGGKRRQALDIVRRFKSVRFRGHYYEPFVGGGAVFFALRASGWEGRGSLYDMNPDLICAYQVVRDSPNELIKKLRSYVRKHSAEFYMRVRTQKPGDLSNVSRAARMIYLNKTCFNGLWRVNKKGQFNVPMGSGHPNICDPIKIIEASIALKQMKITCGDFERVWKRAKAGDVVYFDPPYLPITDLPAFTSYTSGGFTMSDQRRLADVAKCLCEMGVVVIISGADTKETRVLYESRGFSCDRVEALRSINSDGAKRGAVGELLISRRTR